MRLTVIPIDRTILKDGVPLVFDFAADPEIHAIQWYGTHGTIERLGGAEWFDDTAVIAPFVAAYVAEAERLAAIAAQPAPPPTPTTSTSLEFMDRFTEAEQLAIVTATMSVPQVKLWYDRMIAATQVVYADPRVIGGLNALVEAGLLEASRVGEILPVGWRGA